MTWYLYIYYKSIPMIKLIAICHNIKLLQHYWFYCLFSISMTYYFITGSLYLLLACLCVYILSSPYLSTDSMKARSLTFSPNTSPKLRTMMGRLEIKQQFSFLVIKWNCIISCKQLLSGTDKFELGAYMCYTNF